jgi:two-component system sensor histidine kinase KdpD
MEPRAPSLPPAVPRSDSAWTDYATVFWLTLGMAVAGLGLEALAGYRVVGFSFLLYVLALGLFFPAGPVAFGALLSAFVWDFGFIPPRFTFAAREPEDTLLLAAYLATAGIIGALTVRLRRLQERAQREAERANFLYHCETALSADGADPASVIACLRQAERALDLRLGLLQAQADGSLPGQALSPETFLLGRSELRQATESLQLRRSLGWEQAASYTPRLLTLPLDLGAGPVAVLCCRRADGQEVDEADRADLAALSGLLGQHLLRRRLRERSQEAEALRASEQLHQALFASLSHELRTPLTAVLAGAEALQGAGASEPATRESLAADLADSAGRLRRSLENLLDSARLDAGHLQPRLDWQDPGELLRLCLSHLGKALDGHPVQVQLSAEPPLLKVDHRLLEHALSNVLLNAAAYAPRGAAIALSDRVEGSRWVLDLRDQGPGIPPEARERIFERFYRLPGSPAGGTGLGLHISRGFLRAHGGELSAEDPGPQGGALFRLSLPLPDAPPSAAEAP